MKTKLNAVKQTTVEKFEFECSRCVKKVNLKSSIPVVKATTRLRTAIRNFVALSFLVYGQYFKDYHEILGALSGSRQFHSVDGLSRSQKDRRLERA